MYSIKPLHVGTLTVDRSTLTYLRGFGRPEQVPCIIWVLRSGDRAVVVDTGPPPPAFTSRHHVPMTQTPDQEPAAALARAGVDPAAVRTVILTHLHFDHAANNHLFPNATLIVQQRELAYARDPLPIHRRGYQHPQAGFSRSPADAEQLAAVDGDVDLEPGLTLLLTPGHTPGLQSVLVQTARGPVLLASDNVPLAENWQGEPPLLPHIPSGIHVDLKEYFASLDRMARLGARVIPGHDFAVLQPGVLD